MGRKVDFTAICCQNSRATGAIGRMGHANSVSGRRGPEWESSRPKSGTGLGKRALFWRTVVALVGTGKRPRGGPMVQKRAAKGVETTDAEVVLSASRVNWWGGGSAPDRQAPHAIRLRSGIRREFREQKCLQGPPTDHPSSLPSVRRSLACGEASLSHSPLARRCRPRFVSHSPSRPSAASASPDRPTFQWMSSRYCRVRKLGAEIILYEGLETEMELY